MAEEPYDRQFEADRGRGQECSPPTGSTHRIEIESTHRTPERQFYRVWHQGKVLLERTWDPEFSACRALMALGIRGQLECHVVGADHVGLRLDIQRGAGLRTIETRDDGPRIGKWIPFAGVDAEHAFPAEGVEQGRAFVPSPVERPGMEADPGARPPVVNGGASGETP